ncbi:DNA polymerase III subunit delta [Allosphingosinicella flava]|uniref:DNA-directed DNA polymerase n=1 Tax=Allosphingosinicella flava TaxID=2771430 RepID=A0A7T2GIK6_9SPHN|nr:DNA polymerase III subunit delta [Sphingosinicella flava]QPQ54530.1 DNA polymerase III subunit delta [Sphingosinicella flava]
MKANRGQVEKALRAPGPDTRFILLHGPDDAGSRALAKLLGQALGGDAERIDLSGAELKADPARLADEAASISMFGGARYIEVDPAGDECAAAVEALIEAPAAGNPVLLLGGALKGTSRLLKLALAAPNALAFASYAPEGRDAGRVAMDLAREQGLTLRPDVAQRIADITGGNRALIDQEMRKYALYADAEPDRPQAIDHDVIDAVGAASDEGDLSRIVDAVAGGDPALLKIELARLATENVEGIALLRAVLRRFTLLARMRASVEGGNSLDAVMTSEGKALFWKEKPAVQQQLGRWRGALLARALERLLDAERLVKSSGGPGPIAAEETLFAIARQAARLR